MGHARQSLCTFCACLVTNELKKTEEINCIISRDPEGQGNMMGAFFLLYCGQIDGKNISQFGQKHKNSDNPLLPFSIQVAKNMSLND